MFAFCSLLVVATPRLIDPQCPLQYGIDPPTITVVHLPQRSDNAPRTHHARFNNVQPGIHKWSNPPPWLMGSQDRLCRTDPEYWLHATLVQLCRVPSVEIDRGENGRNILGQVRPPAGRIGGVMARVHWSLRFPTLLRRRGHLTKRWRKEKEQMQT